MKYNKKLLICLPSFNRAELLKVQLDKLIKCKKITNIDLDIYVINNGSNDNTRNLLAEYNKDEISIVHNSKNKNWGDLIFQISVFIRKKVNAYDYFWILSDDDFIFEKGLADYLNEINLDSGHNLLYVLRSIKISHDCQKITRPQTIENIDNNIYEVVNDLFLISSVIYPIKDIFNEFDHFYERYKNNDYAHLTFILSALKMNKKLSISNEILFTENNRFIFNNDLYQCFYVDRNLILKELDRLLNINESKKYIISTVNFFVTKSILWHYLDEINSRDSKVKKIIFSSIKDFNFNFRSLIIFIIYFLTLTMKKYNIFYFLILRKIKKEKQSRKMNKLFVDRNKNLEKYNI
jgi:hypothetical protein